MQPTTNRGFSVRAFSEGIKRKLSPKEKQKVETPKGILRQSSVESTTSSNCSYCEQNNRSYNYDTLKSRIGAIPGCQICAMTNNDSFAKKKVTFDTIVRERNYLKPQDELSSRKKYRKLSQSYHSAKTVKPCYQSALYACSVCNITMATESDFITHQRQHGMSPHLMQYPFPYQYQNYKSVSPLMFVRQ